MTGRGQPPRKSRGIKSWS